ncbi:MAG: T9SS type A sorting domain-containing protein [Fimbriimonadaceae bacterium]|nr:T9SS type A sorting domain-containing protein [Chitinophagales bacterium]
MKQISLLNAIAFILWLSPAHAQVTFDANTKQGKGIWGDVYGFHIANSLDQCEDGRICWDWVDSLQPEIFRFPSGGRTKYTHLVKNVDGEWIYNPGWGYNYDEIEDYLIRIYLAGYDVSSLEELAIDSLYPGVFNPDIEINSCLEEELEGWKQTVANQNDDPEDEGTTPNKSYLENFITHVQALQLNGSDIQVIYCANILTATPEENIASINKMLDAGIQVAGIEMGNEMFYGSKPPGGMLFKGDVGTNLKDCSNKRYGDPDNNELDSEQGGIAAQAYYDYINGVQNENTACWLYEFQERGHVADTGVFDENLYCIDTVIQSNDYIGSFKTNFPTIKIAVSCSSPAIANYQTINNGIVNYHPNGEHKLYAGWDSLLGTKYNDTRLIDGVLKKTFDSYVAHTYFDSRVEFIPCIEDFVNNDINTWQATSVAYDGIENEFTDSRLTDAFNCGREEFMNYINYGFKKYQDYFDQRFQFNVAGNSKTLWITEWNIMGRTNYYLDENEDYTNFDPDHNGLGMYNADIFYNSFLQSSLIFNWQHKMIGSALSTNLNSVTKRGKSSRLQYATFHSLFNEKPSSPITQKLELDADDIYDDPDPSYEDNQRKRITYYTFSLIKDIYAENLKWIPLTVESDDTINFHLYGYLDNTDDNYLYIYFDNISDTSKVLDLNPHIIGKNKIDTAEQKKIKYFQTAQLYSGNGYTPILGHNEYYNSASGIYAPFSVEGFTEFNFAGTEFEIPKFSQGYIKIPLIEPKVIGKYAAEQNAPCNNYAVNYSLLNKEFYFQDLEEKQITRHLFIYDALGNLVMKENLSPETLVNLSSLANGIYVYVIASENGNCSDVFCVQD